MTAIPPSYFLVLSASLLGIGVFGILTRRNFILLLIAVEIAMNAAILNFVLGNYPVPDPFTPTAAARSSPSGAARHR